MWLACGVLSVRFISLFWSSVIDICFVLYFAGTVQCSETMVWILLCILNIIFINALTLPSNFRNLIYIPPTFETYVLFEISFAMWFWLHFLTKSTASICFKVGSHVFYGFFSLCIRVNIGHRIYQQNLLLGNNTKL